MIPVRSTSLFFSVDAQPAPHITSAAAHNRTAMQKNRRGCIGDQLPRPEERVNPEISALLQAPQKLHDVAQFALRQDLANLFGHTRKSALARLDFRLVDFHRAVLR